jgi:multidrug transporter EmrE-like cation transporter
MKNIKEKKMYLIILQALPVLIFSYMAQVLMKKGSVVFSNLTWETFLTNPLKTLSMFLFNWQIMLGFVLAGIGAIIYLFVLSKNDFGVVFPVLGALGFLVLPLISWLVLNESISPGKIFGTVIIAIGMLIVARG